MGLCPRLAIIRRPPPQMNSYVRCNQSLDPVADSDFDCSLSNVYVFTCNPDLVPNGLIAWGVLEADRRHGGMFTLS